MLLGVIDAPAPPPGSATGTAVRWRVSLACWAALRHTMLRRTRRYAKSASERAGRSGRHRHRRTQRSAAATTLAMHR